MDSVRLGKTGMRVSRVGFGGIPIQRLDEEGAVGVVRRCLELGITFIDTANAYTTSEERIGRAISDGPEGLIVATKSHARTAETIERDLQLSLSRLGIRSIDLYQFHQVGDFKTLETILEPAGPLAAVQEAREAGKVKHIGITTHAMEVALEAVRSGRFETVMFPFNFIANEAERELIPLARAHDVGFIAMKPMGGGMVEDATIAFKYLLQFPDVVPIPGIEKPGEIEEIVAVVEGPREMTDAERERMQRIRDELGTRFCRRCDYCQPCTEGIPISTVMVSESFAKRFPPERFFSGRIVQAMEKAAECSDCGECEERCPYELPIREMLAERLRWYREEKDRFEKRSRGSAI